MNKDILVSVIIPTYNSDNFIRECLDATISQTYTNIEILIVDDKSVDSTVEICKEYTESDHRIRLFSVPRAGVSAARNCGIKNAKGQYIVFFDADDLPERDLIESYLKANDEWQDKTLSVITCGMFYDNHLYKNIENRVVILESVYGFVEGENYLLERNYAASLAWLKIFNFVTNKLYNVEKIRKFKIYFDETVNIGEDLKFNIEYLSKCDGSIGMINRPLYHYVKRVEGSLSLTYHENDIEDTKAIYRSFISWESDQRGVTKDNILVIKSIFITDWISRLTTKYDHFKLNGKLDTTIMRELDSEIGCIGFQDMLDEVYRSHKISSIRYLALKTRKFYIFCFLRRIYQRAKE